MAKLVQGTLGRPFLFIPLGAYPGDINKFL